ncbi:acyl-phosphate glycerol 3-phosphate acyltransferase [Candidatus Saganbacteria bacterium CG08_land_8_20_14_0_20_45_16]|uniref:Glycerol-3-phosphate acyltransferase n=1 Tax=Candidatus Saganbacteria bacterium CG08_land_8_20_14_0_20_45_16 TaxID=2014293 RepID=A0A2H0XVS0_UNCSA|nr:MAG: acyl-phosphate glycerol 3-phosphate acyltransferase [Candidatus Saganbacteria bacterium CG08_land_8_20_14_0_20_45_16]
MQNLGFILLAYLVGSIPFSHIFPKLKGKDVSQAGSKNIGATNALVVAGPIMGALALLGDILKGYLPVFLVLRYNPFPWVVIFVALATIVGHDFSVFLKFKGGKGVATTGGCLLAFDPVFAILVLLIWILTIVVSRYFILSTILVLAGLPWVMLILGLRGAIVWFALGACLLSFYTHRDDLKRLLAGQEIRADEAVGKFLSK